MVNLMENSVSKLYQRVKDGIVNGIAAPLPRSWNTSDGEILAFDLITNPEEYGFYPWYEVLPTNYNHDTHKIVPRDVVNKTKRTVQRVWDNVALTPAEIEANKPPIPNSVTPLQMRKALRAAGLKSTVDAYVETLDEEAQEAWEFCIEVKRDDTFIVDAVSKLGLTTKQRDDLFVLAASF
jgi:hypothetical protein